MLPYSTFALNEFEKESDHVLLCRTHVFSDAVVELLNYDEELLSRSIPVKTVECALSVDRDADPRYPAPHAASG